MKKDDFVYMYILNGGEGDEYSRSGPNRSAQQVAADNWKETHDFLNADDYDQRMQYLTDRVYFHLSIDDWNFELEPMAD